MARSKLRIRTPRIAPGGRFPHKAPPLRLLVKLGSIVVHADEATTPNADHPLDVSAIRALLADDEVQRWLAQMHEEALLPVKR
jgi:hypothetical protein